MIAHIFAEGSDSRGAGSGYDRRDAPDAGKETVVVGNKEVDYRLFTIFLQISDYALILLVYSAGENIFPVKLCR
jgi:hypothetical protein